MNLINNQYLRYYLTNKNDIAMHDIIAIYNKVRTSIFDSSKEHFVFGENCRFYPNEPKMTDMEIVSLAITAQCLQIDSESLLWSKLKNDYHEDFPDLIHRATSNRRRKQLTSLIQICMDCWPTALEEYKPSDTLIIEFHLITTEYGVHVDFMTTPESTSDIQFLNELTSKDQHLASRTMLGDRGYVFVSKVVELDLFDSLGLTLDIPYRRNQRDLKEYSFDKKIKRKSIEVVFSQYCDDFLMRRNHTKRFTGLEDRISTKIAAKTFKQYWNVLNDKPINQTKHSLAA